MCSVPATTSPDRPPPERCRGFASPPTTPKSREEHPYHPVESYRVARRTLASDPRRAFAARPREGVHPDPSSTVPLIQLSNRGSQGSPELSPAVRPQASQPAFFLPCWQAIRPACQRSASIACNDRHRREPTYRRGNAPSSSARPLHHHLHRTFGPTSVDLFLIVASLPLRTLGSLHP
jgi:hypothetical protein